MFVETVTTLSTGVSVIELGQRAFPTFKKILTRLKRGDLKIAIFGAGGIGKTTLGKLLSKDFQLESLFSPYQESITIEEYQLDSNVFGSVVVVPGQERRQDNWHDILRMIAVSKIQLIIHVVSWGYHSFGEISYTNHRLYQSGMTVEEFVEEYTKERRRRELDVLEHIAPQLSIADSKKTIMITLVNKQDLWWQNRQLVKDYYMNGDYERVIQKIQNQRGAANFIHEYRSVSLVMENFVSGANELLVATTGGYDDRIKFANLEYLLSAIETLLKISLGR
jgi:hypothetical protein